MKYHDGYALDLNMSQYNGTTNSHQIVSLSKLKVSENKNVKKLISSLLLLELIKLNISVLQILEKIGYGAPQST